MLRLIIGQKDVDTDEWMLNPIHFRQLDKLWGPHSVDRNYFQLPGFCHSGAFGPKLLMLLMAVRGGENNWLKLNKVHLWQSAH